MGQVSAPSDHCRLSRDIVWNRRIALDHCRLVVAHLVDARPPSARVVLVELPLGGSDPVHFRDRLRVLHADVGAPVAQVRLRHHRGVCRCLRAAPPVPRRMAARERQRLLLHLRGPMEAGDPGVGCGEADAHRPAQCRGSPHAHLGDARGASDGAHGRADAHDHVLFRDEHHGDARGEGVPREAMRAANAQLRLRVLGNHFHVPALDRLQLG
mmetsp:Transcript_42128/g.86082  ORF Transcript_42128/g.86082 Transcript_42128/m.86082 type:complete len:212 (-) Transcript_42128:504-1139(-)